MTATGAETGRIRHCRQCGTRVVYRLPDDGDTRVRAVCPACHTIHYENPLNVVGTIPTWGLRGEQVLLCKRNIEPRRGYWTLPAGFMELGETTEQGAARETQEEAGAHFELQGLFSVVNVARVGQVHLYYRARLIDTVFTQVKRNVWVMLGHFSRKTLKRAYADSVQRILFEKKKDEKLDIIQFDRKSISDPVYFNNLEDLLDDISRNDLGSREKTRFIYSGNNEFPYDAREQWTDSCNLLALREGVVLGYDRNDRTIEAFRNNGFDVIEVKALLEDFEQGRKDPQRLEDTLILMPSAELSRARGGFHCMSLPLLRDKL